MKSRMVVIALADNFGSNVSKIIAKNFNLFFFNIDEFIECSLAEMPYQIINSDNDFLQQKEYTLIKNALSYEKTLFYCNYETYVNNLKNFKNCCIIYISLTFSQLKELNESNFFINNIAFEERNKYLCNVGQVVKSDVLNVNEFANCAIHLLKGNK